VAAGFLVLMLALSLLRTQWRNWRLLGFWLGWPYLLRPRRALED